MASLRHRTNNTTVNASKSAVKGNEAKDLATFTPPSFTIKDLLGAIPKECFERSALKSGAYLAGDLAMLGAFAYLASFIDIIFGASGSVLGGGLGRIARVAAWAVYAICAGSVGTGVWVIAHECGHQAFSPSKTINNTVGWIFHSALLVPYHSWRISVSALKNIEHLQSILYFPLPQHARHHAATGSMERDEVFVPKTRSQVGLPPAHETVAAHGPAQSTFEAIDDLLEDAPLWNLLNLTLQQTLGWPLYLIKNASGQNYGRWTNRMFSAEKEIASITDATAPIDFDPESPIFNKRHFMQIIISDIGLAIVLGALTLWGMNRGFAEVARYYIIPYFIVNHHLVAFTYLQHTDPVLPHYRKGEWSFQRGALCTIDRSLYGAFGNYIFHGILNSHVAHHVCSAIPHYNADKATEALKEVLGENYHYDPTNIYVALYRSYSQCKFVEDEGSCVFYKNAKGKALREVVYETDSGVGLSDGNSSADEPDLDIEN
ncbi:hypothetical protein EMMF5_003621 [Cystobasidiomycetes sp. EMM_F5]